MRAERSQRIGQLLQAALRYDDARRESFLTQSCAGDETLRREVESLLSSVQSRSPQTRAATAPDAAPRGWQETVDFAAPACVEPEEGPGATLDHYVLLGRLGSGGMGIVQAAYDPELGRKVAIKLLRPGRVDPELGRARLMREAQAMARLSHPNVIAIYHVGTWRDQVFVVMEYVDGGTLRQWLDEKPRSVDEIMSVFVQAGRGLAAAHSAGLMHRDFKPDNVLPGKDGRVRAIDFGLARAVEDNARGADPTEGRTQSGGGDGSLEISLTCTGAVLGTPAYMAPEQRASGEANPSTDQYSFCVALYEALYGERPVPDAGSRDPRAAAGSVATSASRKSSPVPAWIRDAVWRGLGPDKSRRHPSMDALLEALTRNPAAKRRRALVAAAGVLGVAAVLLGSWQIAHQRSLICKGAEQKLLGAWDPERKSAIARAFRSLAKPYGEDALKGVGRSFDAYAESWARMHTQACEATRIRGEQSEELLDLRMACLSSRREELRALGDLLSQADAKLMTKAVDAAQLLTPLSGCADAKALLAPVRPPADPATRAKVEEVRKKLATGRAHELAGQYAEASKIEIAAVAEAKEIGYRPLEAEALASLGQFQTTAGDVKAAETTLKDAVLAASASGHDFAFAKAWIAQVGLYIKRARFHESDEAIRSASAALERLGGNDELLGDLLNDTAVLREGQGKYDQALVNHQRALEIRKRLLGPVHRDVAQSLNNLGIAYARLDNDDQALEAYRGALSIYEQTLGPGHPRLALSLNNIGNVLRRQRKLDPSRAAYERAIAIVEQAEGPEAFNVALPVDNLGILCRLQGRFEEALALHQRALKIRQRELGEGHPDVGATFEHVGQVLVDQKKPGEALSYFERQLAIDEKALGAEHPYVASDLMRIGRLLLDLHQSPKAITSFERALQLREARPGKASNLGEVRFALARALDQAGRDRGRARSLASQAREVYASDPEKNAKPLAEIDAWLGGKR
ncbi:MAG TPA: serine/threonine-protein kinase [Myxococcaceae bacterium]|nr:serine/threonine-protein kinase [Myxococcaceae bacterium]